MSETQTMRLSQVARKLNVGLATIVDTLEGKGHAIDSKPNTKISAEQYNILRKEFHESALDKEEASEMTIGLKHKEDVVLKATEPVAEDEPDEEEEVVKSTGHRLQGIKVVGKIDLNPKKKEAPKPAPAPEPKKEAPKPAPAPEVKKEAEKPVPTPKEEAPKAPPAPEAKKEEAPKAAPTPEAKKEADRNLHLRLKKRKHQNKRHQHLV